MNSTRELAEKIFESISLQFNLSGNAVIGPLEELITAHCKEVAREAKREMRESASRKFKEMVRAAAPGLLLDYNAVAVALRTLPLDALTGIQNACGCTDEYNCPLHLNPAQQDVGAAQSEMCRLCGCRGVRTTGACTCVCHFGLSDAEPGDDKLPTSNNVNFTVVNNTEEKA